MAQHAFFGNKLRFHPTSESVETVAASLPSSVPIITTDELFEGIDYQALNVAESYGLLRFLKASDLSKQFVTFRDIVVLDRVPNDISVTLGIITSEFQTPLAHINVLSQNRGTPNMAFHGAYDLEQFREFEDKWVRLSVGPFNYELEEVSKEEADAWWEEHKPGEVQVPGANTDVVALTDCETMLADFDPKDGPAVVATIKEATRAFGGKAAHYAALTHIEGLPVPDGFGVPIYDDFQFMEENGFDIRISELLKRTDFQENPEVRENELAALRKDMQAAPVNAEFEALLLNKIAADYPVEKQRLRFRSSTNAEDLDGFTGAGLYTSKSGDPNDASDPVLEAVREVWSSVWYFRAFEERSYRSIDHLAVGMALLVHPSFPDEEANGVALTDNPFDKSGLEPAFYVNVQYGGESVVLPPAGISTDEFPTTMVNKDSPRHISATRIWCPKAKMCSHAVKSTTWELPSNWFEASSLPPMVPSLATPAGGRWTWSSSSMVPKAKNRSSSSSKLDLSEIVRLSRLSAGEVSRALRFLNLCPVPRR